MFKLDTTHRVKDRAVLITGASSGIGEATAIFLDSLGFRVFAGVRNEKAGEALKQKASALLTPVMIDVTDQASITCAVETVSALVGNKGLAGLVNNAGIAVAGPLEFLPVEKFRYQFEVNLIGQLATTQAFLPLLRQGQGRIVNISSIMGKGAIAFAGPYCSTKFALEALSDSLRMELLPWKIPVSLIEPGSIATPFWDQAVKTGDEVIENLPERGQHLYGRKLLTTRKSLIYWGKLGTTPAAVVNAVAHALIAKKPRTRYPVGLQAVIWGLFIKLPDRLKDRVLVFGLETLGKYV